MRDKNSDIAGRRTVVIYKTRSSPGLATGLVGSVFALLAIFTIGVIFLPFAILFSLLSLTRSVSGFSAAGFCAAAMAVILTAIGFSTSPSAWLTAAYILSKNSPSTASSPIVQNSSRSIDLLQQVPLSSPTQSPKVKENSLPLRPPTPTAVEVRSTNVGPTYNCATARDALARIICADADLRRADVEMTQPYFALRHAFPGESSRLKQEAVEFQRYTISSCAIVQENAVMPDVVSTRRGCVLAAYLNQRRVWMDEVKQRAPEALDEIERSAEAHVGLQRRLKSAGFLSAAAEIDGIYGVDTRAAIQRAQSQFGLSQTGFAGSDLAARLD